MSSSRAALGAHIGKNIARRGLMLVLSSPSGAGKTTISRALLKGDPNLTISVSVTTRPPRAGERDGIDYFFVDRARFNEMVTAGELLEHAEVFGNGYGTPREGVNMALSAGRDVLFDIDWQGTQQLAESAGDDLASIFILPPSTEELERRLRARAQDSDKTVRGRMAKAADEMSHFREYDYIIVNRDIRQSVAEARAILTAERLKLARHVGLRGFVEGLRVGP
ncbi:MAG: guanylate kinase [Rhodospirillaceae bacterium]|nr:guanylate kinase [Rhodospirillaceae bacterium]MCY4237371.1 guanylate kinase [Rhodospirillaceae bacterium]